MEKFNELVCQYYSAVDGKQKKVAEDLLKEILDSLAKDLRILKVLSGLEEYDRDVIISELNYVFWKNGLIPQKRWDINKGAQFITWMVRVAKNKVVDMKRAKSSYKKIRGNTEIDPESLGENKRIKVACSNWLDEKREELKKRLIRLNPNQRQTITLRMKGYKGIEIAKIVDRKPPIVSREMKTAIKLLGISPDELGSFIGYGYSIN